MEKNHSMPWESYDAQKDATTVAKMQSLNFKVISSCSNDSALRTEELWANLFYKVHLESMLLFLNFKIKVAYSDPR